MLAAGLFTMIQTGYWTFGVVLGIACGDRVAGDLTHGAKWYSPEADEAVCPDCAELVQPEARICRYCHFNFETGIGSDGKTRAIEAPNVAAQSVAMETAWAQLKDGDTESALDQAYVALHDAADHPELLSDLAIFATIVHGRNPPDEIRSRADALVDLVEQEQAKIG